jgi:hypothetical protein
MDLVSVFCRLLTSKIKNILGLVASLFKAILLTGKLQKSCYSFGQSKECYCQPHVKNIAVGKTNKKNKPINKHLCPFKYTF